MMFGIRRMKNHIRHKKIRIRHKTKHIRHKKIHSRCCKIRILCCRSGKLLPSDPDHGKPCESSEQLLVGKQCECPAAVPGKER